jgi:hypothetical protein
MSHSVSCLVTRPVAVIVPEKTFFSVPCGQGIRHAGKSLSKANSFEEVYDVPED